VRLLMSERGKKRCFCDRFSLSVFPYFTNIPEGRLNDHVYYEMMQRSAVDAGLLGMKVVMNVLVVIFISGCFSCEKDEFVNATVLRDCSGTYLRMNSKDYLVCNLDKIQSYGDGVNLKVAYSRLKECDDPEVHLESCFMYHPNEGWIKVDKIE
jgi:hypothetical protein